MGHLRHGYFAILAAMTLIDPTPAPAEPVNLAIAAEATCSYHSHDTSPAALNDGFDPKSSRDWRHGTFGTYNHHGTEWVQYEWSQPISTDRVDAYWWVDRWGINLPVAARLLAWDGEAFQPVGDLGVEPDKYNTLTFEKLTTTKLRLEFDSKDDKSTGLLEWRVLDSGDSPAFPPVVLGDIDRTVVLGGRTYLSGRVKSASSLEGLPVAWSKTEGPGEVTFADAAARETTATFSELGDYTLAFTAGEGDLTDSKTLRVRVVAEPPADSLETVETAPYKIDNPLWNDRAKALITSWIPHCVEKISDPHVEEGGLNNFEQAAKKIAGEESGGEHGGYPFNNAWVLQTLESMCVALMVDPQGDGELIAAQAELRKTIDKWVPLFLAAQEPDGYFQTAFTLNDNRQRWNPASRGDHEGYIAGYFIEAGLAHYRLTGGEDTRLFDAAVRLADCWDKHIGPGEDQQPWYNGHQGMELALYRLADLYDEVHGAGEGDKYRSLAKFLLDCRGGGTAYDQSHAPVQQQYEAVGHAVRAVYQYTAMADVALQTRDKDYLSAVASLQDNLINRKYYVTGGIGSGETSEGFGKDYSLPRHGYCESCSSCGELFFQHRLHRLHRTAEHADLYETTFYNALLGSIDREAQNFFYNNPLVSDWDRYDWHVCPCCVGNIPRTILMMPTWACTRDDDSLFVNLFLGGTFSVGEVAGTPVELVQETDYPWSGKVAMTVNPAEAAEFALRVRSPRRDVSELYTTTPDANGIDKLLVNGEPFDAPIVDGYAVIERAWAPGDTVEIELPMTIQRVKCDPRVAANRGLVALRRGPLIYTVESVDGGSEDSILDPEAELTAEWRPDLLGGVMVLTGQYADGKPFTAIPNYARANRGGKSWVWIKDR